MLYSIFELTVVLVLATSLHIAPLSNVVSAIIKDINIACFHICRFADCKFPTVI